MRVWKGDIDINHKIWLLNNSLIKTLLDLELYYQLPQITEGDVLVNFNVILTRLSDTQVASRNYFWVFSEETGIVISPLCKEDLLSPNTGWHPTAD